MDTSSNTLNYRIRTAQNQKIPYMLIVGDKESQDDLVSVRVRNGDDHGAMKVDAFVKFIEKKIESKDKE